MNLVADRKRKSRATEHLEPRKGTFLKMHSDSDFLVMVDVAWSRRILFDLSRCEEFLLCSYFWTSLCGVPFNPPAFKVMKHFMKLSVTLLKTRCVIFIMFELWQNIFPFQVVTVIWNRSKSVFRRVFLNLFINQFLHPWMTLLETWLLKASFFPELLIHYFTSQVRLLACLLTV